MRKGHDQEVEIMQYCEHEVAKIIYVGANLHMKVGILPQFLQCITVKQKLMKLNTQLALFA